MTAKNKFLKFALATAISALPFTVYAQDASDPFAGSVAATAQPPAFSPMGNSLPVMPPAGATGATGGNAGFNISPEQAAELEKRLEEEEEARKEKLRKQSFDSAVGEVLPLKPEEIREMLDYFRQSREAAETPMSVPVPKVQIQNVSLDPGALPNQIKTAPGHVTTLNILDMTGQPWPIRDFSWAGQYEVNPPEEGGHVIRITPLSAHGIGNISIQLVDLITPITFSLNTNLEETHYRFDARIPKLGPMASVPIISHGGLSAVAEDEGLISFLEGTPPSDAVRMNVSGPDGRTKIWEIGEEYFLRTPLSLLSPAWNSSIKSADGMNVYALSKASVILLSDNGKIVQAHVKSQEE
jgi:intracellular multiplication protein IcmK